MTQSTFDQAVNTFERLGAEPSAQDIISLSNYLAALPSVQDALGSTPPTLIEQAVASETVIDFLLSGRKILAIKELRNISGGASLKESKDAVESLEVQAEVERRRPPEPMPDWEQELLGVVTPPVTDLKVGDKVQTRWPGSTQTGAFFPKGATGTVAHVGDSPESGSGWGWGSYAYANVDYDDKSIFGTTTRLIDLELAPKALEVHAGGDNMPLLSSLDHYTEPVPTNVVYREGDRVRLVVDHGQAKQGELATVIEHRTNDWIGSWVHVEFDREGLEQSNGPDDNKVELVARKEDLVHGFVKGERVTIRPNPVYYSAYRDDEIDASWIFLARRHVPVTVAVEQGTSTLAQKNVLLYLDGEPNAFIAPESLTRYVEPEPAPEPEVFTVDLGDYWTDDDKFYEFERNHGDIISLIDYNATEDAGMSQSEWRVFKAEAVEQVGEFKPVEVNPTLREQLDALPVGAIFGPDRDGDYWKKTETDVFKWAHSQYANDFIGYWTLDMLLSDEGQPGELLPSGVTVVS